MASRANKYSSLNFNDIYEKKVVGTANKHHPSPSSSSPSPSSLTSPARTILSNSRIHGNMLVLSRPSPKPVSQPTPPPPQQQQQRQQQQQQQPPPQQLHHHQPTVIPDQPRFESDSISLRPLGRTGSGPSVGQSPLTSPKPEKEFSHSPSPSSKPHRFVPPHLRPGFAGREERPGPELQKQPGRAREFVGHRQGQFGSSNRYGEDGRPKSGGGYERMRRGGDSDLVALSRPSSSGARPSSSG